MNNNTNKKNLSIDEDNAIELQTHQIVPPSPQTREINRRQEKLDSLARLSNLAKSHIQKGLELALKTTTTTNNTRNEDAENSEQTQNSAREFYAKQQQFTTTDQNTTNNTLDLTYNEDEIDSDSSGELYEEEDEHVIEYIGNLRCFWPDTNGKPRITIGQHWKWILPLAAIVFLVFSIQAFSIIQVYQIWTIHGLGFYAHISLIITCVLSGLFSFVLTFLGDPGIPKEVYEMKSQPNLRHPDLPDSTPEGFLLCYDCYVYKIEGRKHCQMCNVCIDDYDHHCTFFSKCIGGGTIKYFNFSLLAFIVNVLMWVVCQLWLLFQHKAEKQLQ